LKRTGFGFNLKFGIAQAIGGFVCLLLIIAAKRLSVLDL